MWGKLCVVLGFIFDLFLETHGIQGVNVYLLKCYTLDPNSETNT